jgi:hypothetical protein
MESTGTWNIIISGLAPFLLGTNHFVCPCPLFTNLTFFSLTAITPISPPIDLDHLSYRDTFRHGFGAAPYHELESRPPLFLAPLQSNRLAAQYFPRIGAGMRAVNHQH